jgi:hypothetical protein
MQTKLEAGLEKRVFYNYRGVQYSSYYETFLCSEVVVVFEFFLNIWFLQKKH